MSVASRELPAAAAVPAMQRLAVELGRLEGDRAAWHAGDVAWGIFQHAGREDEWRIRVWEDAAWAWVRASGTLEHVVHPEHRGGPLHDELLDWARDAGAREAWAFVDDEAALAALARHGFIVRGDERLHHHARGLAEPPVQAPLPAGFRLRTVEEGDLAERVAVHRDVWHPSRVTEESYANVQRAWPYRRSLDCVAEAPDGRFAAYCLVWLDEANAVGELEPVGTREEFRGRRLATAVCTFALRRLYEEGGRGAIVYSQTEPAAALYASLGFRHVGDEVPFTVTVPA